MNSHKWVCMILFFTLFAVLSSFLGLEAKATETPILQMDGLCKGELRCSDFSLNKDTKIHISAVGAAGRASQQMYAYAWITNRDDHHLVWEMERNTTSPYKKSKSLKEYNKNIDLSGGNYQACYYAGDIFSTDEYGVQVNSWSEFWNFIGDVIDGTKTKLGKGSKEELSDLKLVLTTEDKYYSPQELKKSERVNLVKLDKLGDLRYEKIGFVLDKDMDLNVYALGEYSYADAVMVDFGWIVNAKTRKKVWEMDRTNTKGAGGGKKNRVFDGTIHLPAGEYILFFVTDDSHSFEEWNTSPPYSPESWGITISVQDQSVARHFHRKDDVGQEKTILKLVGVGDDELRSANFSLRKSMSLHIYALGEKSYSEDQLVDYAWIEDANSREVVWEMTTDNTEYAGGAKKNRKFDGLVKLGKGDYKVYYITDDSHSFDDWNDSPPYDSQNWGITISGFGRDFDASEVSVYDKEKKNPNTLVELVGLGDEKRVNQAFELDQPTKVRVYAIGEGDRDEMYDYGWIKDVNSGKTVWEMTYQNTDWAGGARKNRIYDDTIILDSGSYKCYFLTDDSHSFNNWNAPRPKDPYHWGITITKQETTK